MFIHGFKRSFNVITESCFHEQRHFLSIALKNVLLIP